VAQSPASTRDFPVVSTGLTLLTWQVNTQVSGVCFGQSHPQQQRNILLEQPEHTAQDCCSACFPEQEELGCFSIALLLRKTNRSDRAN